MNENPILPARIYIYFPTPSLPQNFPPSYLPPTNPSPPPPHSIARAPETSSGSELGAGELGGELGAGKRLEPEWDPGKHLTLFFSRLFCLFVCGAALQRSIAKKATLRCSTTERKRRWQRCCRCLPFSFSFFCSARSHPKKIYCCFVVSCFVVLQRSKRRRRKLSSPSSSYCAIIAA